LQPRRADIDGALALLTESNSASTRKKYRGQVLRFLRWCDENQVSASPPEPAIIEVYDAELRRSGMPPKRASDYARVARRFQEALARVARSHSTPAETTYASPAPSVTGPTGTESLSGTDAVVDVILATLGMPTPAASPTRGPGATFQLMPTSSEKYRVAETSPADAERCRELITVCLIHEPRLTAREILARVSLHMDVDKTTVDSTLYSNSAHFLMVATTPPQWKAKEPMLPF
jgi:hypothetical protein